MIVDKKIMEIVDSVLENKVSPIEKALLATEIQLYTDNIVKGRKQGEELPIHNVSDSRPNEYPCYACQGGGCPVCCGFGTIPKD